MTLRSLLPFLAITFGLTWGIAVLFVLFPERLEELSGELAMTNPLFVLAVYAPAIAALTLVAASGGVGGLRRFLSRLLLWRCGAGWVAFIVAGIPTLMYVGAALKGTPIEEPFPFSPWHHVIPALAVALFLGPTEELGWRGFALPLLQQRFAPFWATSILGAIWGLWHLPAFLLSGTPQSAWSFGPFFAASVAISFLMTPLFNASRGSLLLVAMVHFQLNNPIYPDAHPYDAVLFSGVALVTFVLYRKTWFSRVGTVTEVVPAQ